MASIFKRKNKDGTSHWSVVVRIKGFDKKSLRKSFMGADGKSIQTLSRYEFH